MYRLLLLAFPKRVRREFGDDMARLFEAQRRAVRESGGGLARFWVSAILDAANQFVIRNDRRTRVEDVNATKAKPF